MFLQDGADRLPTYSNLSRKRHLHPHLHLHHHPSLWCPPLPDGLPFRIRALRYARFGLLSTVAVALFLLMMSREDDRRHHRSAAYGVAWGDDARQWTDRPIADASPGVDRGVGVGRWKGPEVGGGDLFANVVDEHDEEEGAEGADGDDYDDGGRGRDLDRDAEDDRWENGSGDPFLGGVEEDGVVVEEQETASDEFGGDKDKRRWKHVCVIGNTQKEEDALRIHSMWGGRFTAFWFVWGEEEASTAADRRPANLHLFRGGKKTWAQGIHYLLSVARRQHDCEYFFTHDDDLEFFASKSSSGLSGSMKLDAALTDVLLSYQPAVAGFPWTVGDNATDAARAREEKYAAAEVAPLAGFDSGMVIYHKSVVDFFIPFAPRGEGGIKGDWSLCAHFLNLFAPLVLKGSAVRLNSFAYTNRINLDNVKRTNRGPALTGVDGLVLHRESRHPYEYKLNYRYKTLLSDGLMLMNQRWGRTLEPYDITWDVEAFPAPANVNVSSVGSFTTRPQGLRTIESSAVLDNLAAVYDLSHVALSSNEYLRQKFTLEDIYTRSLAPDQTFRLAIHVFTMDRPGSFDRLWSSVNAANTIDRAVEFTIHVDKPDDKPSAAPDDVTELPARDYIRRLQSMTSRHGPVRLDISTSGRGLKQSVLDAWSPNDRREYAIFLEDDVEVSPHFLEYAEQMVARYLHPAGVRQSVNGSERCMGVSLYNMRFQEVDDRPWAVDTGPLHTPYILQHPQSWGAVFRPETWVEFLSWYMALPADYNPLLPMSLTNRWPEKRSWKKFLIRFMGEKGIFMIYPNLPGGLSLSTNHLESGTNDRSTGPKLQKMKNRFTMPLLDLKRIEIDAMTLGLSNDHLAFYATLLKRSGPVVKLNLSPGNAAKIWEEMFDDVREGSDATGTHVRKWPVPANLYLPPMNELPIFNSHFNPAGSITALAKNQSVQSFDKCTMVMPVYSRYEKILDRLEHYHTHPLLDSIVLVWNNPNAAPPKIHAPTKSRARAVKIKAKGAKSVFYIPIHIKVSDRNTMNNRFLPFEEIATDCVISMDDDWDMPHGHITFAIRLWQAQFFHNLVGFKHLGRVHVFDEKTGRYAYHKSGKAGGVSMVLPSGAVYHKKYHEMYTNALPRQARMTVDRLTNCDDILFNMMIANATGSGPVVIDSVAKPLEMGGLWLEPDHFAERSTCLDTFTRDIFGGEMPLKFTTTFFKDRPNEKALPGKKDLKSSKEQPKKERENGQRP
ncbi:Exostoses (Multiple)-like 3 [Irineochytrium annulatum]|nr:Exostoses (Multiple)-like 3 [Irineochytrium annulatum]